MDQEEFAEFDALAAVLAHSGETVDRSGVVRAALDELGRRRLLWRHVAGRARGLPVYTYTSEPVTTVSFFSLGRYYLMVFGILAAGAIAVTVGPVLGAVAGAVVVAGVVAWQGRAMWRRWRLLDSGACLRCRYDLRELPRAVDPGAIDGVDLGPARCPECGRPWPRIPARDGSARA